MTFANHQKECCSPASPPPFVVNTHHDWIRSKLYSQPALPGLTDLTSTSVGEPGLDRTLLRIFAEHTAMSLSDRMRVQRAWSNNVPGLSLSQPFLTGGILALAALHLSKVQQSDDSAVARSYLRMATSKLNESLPVFRGMLETLHSENCNALFIFSTFIVIFLFATASNDCKAHLASLPIYTSLPIRSARRRQNEVEIGSLILFRHVQTLQALRGPLYIIEAFFPLIEKGPCSDICSRDYWPKDPISAAVEKVKTGTRISDALLVSLQELWADEVTDVQRTLDKVLEDLRFSYALVMDLSQDDSGTTDSTRSDQSVFVNNQQAPPPVLTDRAAFLACPTIKLLEFVDLVGQHHKAAMVLLLYYAVLLDRVGDYWYV